MTAKSGPLPTPEDLATERLVAAVESAIDGIQQRLPNLAADTRAAKWSLSHFVMESQNPQVETDAIEDAVIDSVVARDLSKELALISLYGQRTQRACEKYKKELSELQEKRKAEKAVEQEEARLLFQLADT